MLLNWDVLLVVVAAFVVALGLRLAGRGRQRARAALRRRGGAARAAGRLVGALLSRRRG